MRIWKRAENVEVQSYTSRMKIDQMHDVPTDRRTRATSGYKDNRPRIKINGIVIYNN